MGRRKQRQNGTKVHKGNRMNLDQMAAAALARVQEFINRSAGQHLRAMREQWSQT
jgi:hypothetical protein